MAEQRPSKAKVASSNLVSRSSLESEWGADMRFRALHIWKGSIQDREGPTGGPVGEWPPLPGPPLQNNCFFLLA